MELISIIIVGIIVIVGIVIIKEQLIKNKNEKIINRRKSDKEQEK